MRSPTRARIRPLALLAACAAVATMVAPTASNAAAGDEPAATDATISWTPPSIKVKVSSPDADCKPDRRAFILYVTQEGAFAAQGKTNDNGVFNFNDAGSPFGDGSIRAYVGRNPSCRPGQSPAVDVEATPPPAPRASAPAHTSATLTVDENTLKVKVSSPADSCTTGRRVEVFGYGSGQYASVHRGVTNENGVMKSTIFTRGISPVAGKYVAFVRRTDDCTLGQSNTEAAAPTP